MTMTLNHHDYQLLRRTIKRYGHTLGFQQVAISGTTLGNTESRLQKWLAAGHHGEMAYMARHGTRRTRPEELKPGTLSIISVRMDYLPASRDPWQLLDDPARAYISRYALGRDYHKVMRNRLQQLATAIETKIGKFGYRVFVDSAPVMEKPIAAQAGLGWIGKHTNILNRRAGSWFFLGEIYTDLPLPADKPTANHCGNCQSCIDICPTAAIIAPYQLDARRCISYLTIELQGSIPIELRPLIGNRIYGCDDCQLICPWNRFAKVSDEKDFQPRHGLDNARLLELFAWDEKTFLKRMEGSAIRRLGHQRWLRNIAVALGNGPHNTATAAALQSRSHHPSALVREHVAWARTKLHSIQGQK